MDANSQRFPQEGMGLFFCIDISAAWIKQKTWNWLKLKWFASSICAIFFHLSPKPWPASSPQHTVWLRASYFFNMSLEIGSNTCINEDSTYPLCCAASLLDAMSLPMTLASKTRQSRGRPLVVDRTLHLPSFSFHFPFSPMCTMHTPHII